MTMGCDGGASVESVVDFLLLVCGADILWIRVIDMCEYFNHLSEKHNKNYLLPFIKDTQECATALFHSIVYYSTHRKEVASILLDVIVSFVIDDKEDESARAMHLHVACQSVHR